MKPPNNIDNPDNFGDEDIYKLFADVISLYDKDDKKSLKKKVKKHEEQEKQLKGVKQDLDKKISSLQQKNKELEEKIEEQTVQKKLVEDSLKKIEDQNKELKEKLEKSENNKKELEKNFKESKEKISKLEKQEKSVQDMEKEMQTIKSSYEYSMLNNKFDMLVSGFCFFLLLTLFITMPEFTPRSWWVFISLCLLLGGFPVCIKYARSEFFRKKLDELCLINHVTGFCLRLEERKGSKKIMAAEKVLPEKRLEKDVEIEIEIKDGKVIQKDIKRGDSPNSSLEIVLGQNQEQKQPDKGKEDRSLAFKEIDVFEYIENQFLGEIEKYMIIAMSRFSFDSEDKFINSMTQYFIAYLLKEKRIEKLSWNDLNKQYKIIACNN